MNKRLFVLFLIFLFVMTGVVSAQPGTDDTDGDGLPNSIDKCPTEPGPRENDGCPVTAVPDSDGDGLIDTVDKCPNEAGPRENGGCPTSPTDSDGDGTPDTSDRCPTQGGPDSNGGCPETNEPLPNTPADVAVDSDSDGIIDTNDRCPNVRGDSSNGGCPVLDPMPAEGPCVVSPSGFDSVNIRKYATKFSDQIGSLPVNAMAPVLDVAEIFFYAEPEWVDEEDFPLWYLISYNGVEGWVAAAVVRFGGDCSDFAMPQFGTPDDIDSGSEDPQPMIVKMPDIVISSWSSGGSKTVKFPAFIPFLSFDLDSGAWEIGEEDGDGAMDIIVGAGAGGGPHTRNNLPDLDILICPDEDSELDACFLLTTAARAKADILIEFQCVKAGDGSVKCTPFPQDAVCQRVGAINLCGADTMPTDQCPQDAATGKLTCPGGSYTAIIPLDPDSDIPGLFIQAPGTQPILIGLLLPAVQQAREAAR